MCNKQYVGKTSRSIRTRIIEQMRSIRRKDIKSLVASHFNEASHSISDLDFTVIEHISQLRRGGDMERRLLQRECKWIFDLRSLYPLGMNEELVLLYLSI